MQVSDSEQFRILACASICSHCRTRILQEPDPKERERLVLKFMKVMKFLRKHNNFNSYLAFLSALDSASIRRLDWPKAIVDTIKEYSAIIDFTGSFKAYREALNRSRCVAENL